MPINCNNCAFFKERLSAQNTGKHMGRFRKLVLKYDKGKVLTSTFRFIPLGEMAKLYGRNPFELASGPAPPPLIDESAAKKELEEAEKTRMEALRYDLV